MLFHADCRLLRPQGQNLGCISLLAFSSSVHTRSLCSFFFFFKLPDKLPLLRVLFQSLTYFIYPPMFLVWLECIVQTWTCPPLKIPQWLPIACRINTKVLNVTSEVLVSLHLSVQPDHSSHILLALCSLATRAFFTIFHSWSCYFPPLDLCTCCSCHWLSSNLVNNHTIFELYPVFWATQYG